MFDICIPVLRFAEKILSLLGVFDQETLSWYTNRGSIFSMFAIDTSFGRIINSTYNDYICQ